MVVKRESTGFKDSNGKEIHFGDTLKLKDRGLTGHKIDKELKMLVIGSPDFKKIMTSVLKIFQTEIIENE